jgi:ectoine hydroxylase-related dioxygenase (phytanoyl-CoA dioxygenase family)
MSQISKHYQNLGYAIARGLYAPSEVRDMLAHYMKMHEEQRDQGPQSQETDPLKIYPRMLQLHRHDEKSRQYLLDPRVKTLLTEILGAEPYAVSCMFYFKPPKARGQALHQDQYYILSKPEPCVAVWIALDDCDEENGCLRVVPGSQTLPLLDVIPADTTQSFKNITVPLPQGSKEVPAILKAGDALIFNGHVLHGSLPNVSADRFRRALITHYAPAGSTGVAEFFNPAVRFDGTDLELNPSTGPRDDVDL